MISLNGLTYCNSMGHMGYGPRTSKAFPPGWNGQSKTPKIGWRSWYAYYTRMNQDMIENVIDALVAKNRTVPGWDGKVSLCDLGYCTAGIDEGWEGCGEGVNGTQHYLNGTPAVNYHTFPDMKGLVDYGHSKGVKMGWYFNGCGCIEKREPASGWDINYEGDIKMLHEFGFDAVKFDGCGRMCNMTRYAQLMQETGATYEIENCHWGDCTIDDASSCPTQDWCPFNHYRTSGDSNNGMATWYNNLQTTVRFQTWDSPVSRPGCWAYPDMLQVGRLGCSGSTSGCAQPGLINWTRTHFAAFCIVSSPLVLSVHPSDETITPLLPIIGNKAALSINQAWAGHPGSLVRNLPPNAPPCNGSCKEAGTAVVGVPCDSSDSTQTGWVYDAAKGMMTHKNLCLSITAWGDPLTLLSCGNDTVVQKIKYDSTSKHFTSAAPAGGKPGPYPCAMEVAKSGSNYPGKAYFYRPGTTDAFSWELPTASGMIQNSEGQCLAARGSYTPAPAGVTGIQLWAKPLDTNRVAALVINGGLSSYVATVSFAELNATGATTVTDVWSGESVGSIEDGNWTSPSIPSLDSTFVILQR